jgi:hypothetical protein
MLFDTLAKVMQQALIEAEDLGQPAYPLFFDQQTIIELTSIDVNSLSAPEGLLDDHAMAAVLATMCVYRGASNMAQARHDLWSQHEERLQEMMAAMPMQTGRKNKNGLWQEIAPPPEAIARLRARGILK